MEVTKLSSKGQVVIPGNIRQGIPSGTAFIVTKSKGLIVLKEVSGLSQEELKEMNELDEIWDEIDKGQSESYDADAFFKQMKQW